MLLAADTRQLIGVVRRVQTITPYRKSEATDKLPDSCMQWSIRAFISHTRRAGLSEVFEMP